MSNISAGIELGTSYSKIGVFKNGKVQIVPNLIGDPSTPSIVGILDEGEAIGEEIMMHNIDEKHTITQIRRILGKKLSDLKDLKDINYNLVGDNDKLLIKIIRKGKEEFFTPEQIMALIIRKLIKNASDFMGTPITKAVFTVPAYFDSNQRSALEESIKLAEIEILGIISEPTAAALSYGLGTKENLTDSLRIATITISDSIESNSVTIYQTNTNYYRLNSLSLASNEYIPIGIISLSGATFDTGDGISQGSIQITFTSGSFSSSKIFLKNLTNGDTYSANGNYPYRNGSQSYSTSTYSSGDSSCFFRLIGTTTGTGYNNAFWFKNSSSSYIYKRYFTSSKYCDMLTDSWIIGTNTGNNTCTIPIKSIALAPLNESTNTGFNTVILYPYTDGVNKKFMTIDEAYSFDVVSY